MCVQLDSVLIIGGGFSGLASALALSRSHPGARITLVERETQWRMDGAGISIGGASLRALHQLGVLDEFLEQGYASDGTDMLGPGGERLASFPTPRLVGPETPGNGAILRPLLGGILARAVATAGVDVRFGTAPDGFAQNATGVDVRLQGAPGTPPSTERFNLVIAADGISSQTRASLFPDAEAPKYTGQGAWRAVLPRPDGITSTTIWVGGPAKIGVNPISDEQMYLFVNEQAAQRERIPDADLLPRLRSLLAPIPDPRVQAMASALGPGSLLLHRPMDRVLQPLPWHVGRVQLIGDAVHATTPHLAAGAGLGLEDALVLAEELSSHSVLDDALLAFEARRFERCRMVVESSGRLGELEASPEGGPQFGALQAESMRLLAMPV